MTLFDVFLPLSNEQFLKGDFFDSFNGLRYPQVGGTRERHFAGTHFKPRKVPENATSPTRRVDAVLGAFLLHKIYSTFFKNLPAIIVYYMVHILKVFSFYLSNISHDTFYQDRSIFISA